MRNPDPIAELKIILGAILRYLDRPEAASLRKRFRAAIKPGADYSSVWPRFAERMLRRCVGYAGLGDEAWRDACRNAVRKTAEKFSSGQTRLPFEPALGAAAWAREECVERSAAARAAQAAGEAAGGWVADAIMEATQAARDSAWETVPAHAAATSSLWSEWSKRLMEAALSESRQQARDLIELIEETK